MSDHTQTQTSLGKSYPRVDAVDKVSGRMQYTSDLYLPGMLMCKVLKSPKAHARIVHIDTSRAAQLSGVRAIITSADVPDARFGNGAIHDKRILARDKVRHIGEPIAAVAAVDEMTAQEALTPHRRHLRRSPTRHRPSRRPTARCPAGARRAPLLSRLCRKQHGWQYLYHPLQ